ncbi:MAG: hypothetical protein KJ927_20310 [Candidatus Eisenbacteria bacterium]|nr:hypothetical protein [Candidatus Eisenbacteria bacterium]
MKVSIGSVWPLIILVLAISTPGALAEDGYASELGYWEQTNILLEDEDICPGTTILQNDDNSFENGYLWSYGGVEPPDYGSWAECYDAEYVCGIQFLFTQIGGFVNQTMDVYVWDYNAEGNPPPGPDPGNVLCMLTDVLPENIAFWPDISTHNVQVCCTTNGPHFVGFWGNWPTGNDGWFVAADENGPPSGCSRAKVTPGSPYGEGWVEVELAFPNCKALGIREFAGLGDCQPTPIRRTNWGRIKALY